MFSRNYEAINRPKTDDSKLAQWVFLDQSKLLRIDLGIESDSLLELTADRPDPQTVWEQNKFGFKKSRLDAFRNLRLDGSDLVTILQTDRPNFQCFPFSLFKPETTGNIMDPTTYDVCTLRGVNFGKADLSAAHARFAEFFRCRFEGTILTDIIGDGVRFVNCSFDAVQAQKAKLNGIIVSSSGSRQPINFAGLTITNSDFTKAELKDHSLSDSVIVSSNFSGSKFLTRQSPTASNLDGTTIQNSDFLGCEAHLYQPALFFRSLIRSCDFTLAKLKARFRTVIQSTFDFAVFESLLFTDDASIAGSSFINTEFPSGVSFSNVDVRGCDFTGSNLADAMTHEDKNAFIAAVSKVDAETLWVDGKPILEA
ncbi:MAG: pentapeptide repeat-containing protein [Balneolales bacterium]|nr:pentapeptide repeat-containing protein [Balneolales bacterium]